MVTKTFSQFLSWCILFFVAGHLNLQTAFAHNEFLIVRDGVLYKAVFSGPPYTSIVVWPRSTGSSISLYFEKWDIFGLPLSLGSISSKNDVLDAADTWSEGAGSAIGFVESSNSGTSVIVAFTTDKSKFPDVVSNAAVAQNAVEYNDDAERYVFAAKPAHPETDFPQARIYFNNTSYFAYEWTNSVSDLDDDQVCFKQVALHELGHIIGLAECSEPGAVMGPVTLGADFYTLQEADLTGLAIICAQVATGVEDYLVIYDGPTSITQNSDSWYSANFVDEVPYGDYLVSVSWSLLIRHGEGEYVAATSGASHLQLGSLPYGYYWYRDAEGNVLGRARVVGIDDKGISHSASFKLVITGVLGNTTSGTLSHDETWGDENVLAGSITVPSGITLKILRRSVVKFPSGASLIINGKLYANGMPESPVTFTSLSSANPGSWGSIRFSGSAAAYSTLDHVVMQYGSQIECLNGAHAIIQNCTLQNNIYGVYVYNASPWIRYNTIKNMRYHGIIAQNLGAGIYGNTIIKESTSPWDNYHQNCGIWYNGADDYIARNIIKGFGIGVYATYSSNPYFEHSSITDQRNNLITDCNYGVVALEESNPMLGNENRDGSGYNSISCLVRDCDANDGCYVMADNNWWGEYPVNESQSFYIGNGAQLMRDGDLSDDPWEGYSQPLVAGGPLTTEPMVQDIALEPDVAASKTQMTAKGIMSEQSVTEPPERKQLSEGVRFRMERKYGPAIALFKSLYKSGKLARVALSNLYACYKDTLRDEGIKFFGPLIDKNSPDSPLLMRYAATLYALNGDTRSMNKLCDRIIARYRNTSHERYARFQKYYAALHVESDRAAAESFLKDITSKYRDGEDVQLAKYMLSNFEGGEGQDNSPGDSTSSGATEISALLTNYPNPFNPSTTISYRLSSAGKVVLKIYDILGREVMTLAEGYEDAGVHTVRFNGQNLSSGVYFYRLTAPGINQIKKMLMVK